MFGPYQRQRLLLICGCLACFSLFWWLGAATNLPFDREGTVSLLQQPGIIVPALVTIVGFILAIAIGTAITSSVRVEAGLLCAAVGLAALSMRGRSMRYALFASTGPGVYLLFAVELILLFALVAVGWRMLVRIFDDRYIAEIGLHDDDDEPIDQRAIATTAGCFIMIVVLSVLCRSDAKAQVMLSVFFGSLLAAVGASFIVPVRSTLWFLAIPFAAGLLGYLSTYFSADGWVIGQIRSYLAALARPMPLDYASFGTAGTILGCWFSRSQREAAEDARNAAAAPL